MLRERDQGTAALNEDRDSRAPSAVPEHLCREDQIARLREDVLRHLRSLGIPALTCESSGGVLTKDHIRAMHAVQRRESLRREWRALAHKSDTLIAQFADGSEVQPDAIDPELVPVKSDHETGDLFRFATLLWSVPVSRGFGRRMRFLVRDRSNGKLIGVFALGDPVFNLRARDEWIGWSVEDRRERLVHVMDAYVVGSVPPYAQLLGGKLVAALIGSSEVSDAFSARYGRSAGIISGIPKNPRLALVTVTSALGRSSLYNRLRLYPNGSPRRSVELPLGANETDRALVEYVRIGVTSGYGHFQLSDELFCRLRDLLTQAGHPYASGHQFGQGPNWRFRVIRVGLKMLGLDEELIRHGISREIYALPLAENWQSFLRGREPIPLIRRPPADEIAKAALTKWIIPRAKRRPEFRRFRRADLLEGILRAVADAHGASL